MHFVSSTKRAVVPFALFVAAVAGCGAQRSPESASANAPAPPPPPAGYPSMAAPAAAAESAIDAKKSDDASPKKPEETTWKRSQIVPNATRLMVGEKEELPLRTMQAKVTIDGFRARVLIDYVYESDRDRQLEGTFQLRLPEEASPYFFAFGESTYESKPIAGGATGASTQPLFFAASETKKMGDGPLEIMADRQSAWIHPKEARMVPREKAAFAYGETVRRRVDPALMEWAGAGVFSARVFPLAPHKMHRVVVGYDLDLVRIGDDLEYRFDLPEKAPQSMVDVRVAKMNGVVTTTSPKAPALTDDRKDSFHFENPKDKVVTVRLKSPGAPAIVGNDPKTGDYFAAQVKPSLPAAAPSQAMDSAVFLLDTSLSSNPDRFNVWLKMMRTVLEANRPQLKRFNVLFFGVDARWYKQGFAENTPENVDALMTTAGGLALEGATDIGAALGAAAHPGWLDAKPGSKSYDVFLLSDGAATWGEGNLYALGRTLASGSAGALYAYQTGLAGTDVAALTHLARESGGAVFSVTGEAEVVKAATAHRARPWQLVAATVAGGSDVLLAGRPKAIFPGQTLLAVGRGALQGGTELVLTLERDGKQETVRTKLAAPVGSKLAPRAYGQVATTQLEELEAATEGVSKAYATHFRVTGRTCSLLMLETEQDYQRFGIRPEEDAFVVKGTPAGALFATTLKQTYDTLGDPKASFFALLAKLEKTPGVKLQIPASYKMAVTQMPASAFAVDTAPLTTKLTNKAQLAPDLLATLAKHELDYDRISDDAKARQGQAGPGDALKALSSLVEENPGDAVLARDVGFSAMDLGLRPQAYHLFRRVADMRPYEPQTYRAMAQALAAMGKTDLALAYYEIPLLGEWDPRFGDLRTIVELDYYRFLRGIAAGKAKTTAADYAKARLETLGQKIGMTQADLVVTITWNTDNTDVDLHVTEPGGEECFYGHRQTRSGGELTRDVTQGYGPEMYVLKRAPNGRYLVRAHYFASDRNRASARTKVYITTYEDWGTPRERATEKVVALETGKEMHDIALIDRR
jgi:von Willebrand factor type A domain